MEIKDQKKNNYTIVSVSGRLDTTNYQELENKLQQLVDDSETNMIMDCQKLDYISSSGLRVFLMFLKKLKTSNGKFYICNLQDNIQEIFQISGFTNIFKIFDSLEKAESKMS